jgi:hypothetical protein
MFRGTNSDLFSLDSQEFGQNRLNRIEDASKVIMKIHFPKEEAAQLQVGQNSINTYCRNALFYSCRNMAMQTPKAEELKEDPAVNYLTQLLYNELDHYFVGPVQKSYGEGGLPISITEVGFDPLSIANAQVAIARSNISGGIVRDVGEIDQYKLSFYTCLSH